MHINESLKAIVYKLLHLFQPIISLLYSFVMYVYVCMYVGVTPDQIGVVTPYEGQRGYVVAHMQKNGDYDTITCFPTSMYVCMYVCMVDIEYS